jgi:hypothetical protein
LARAEVVGDDAITLRSDIRRLIRPIAKNAMATVHTAVTKAFATVV